MQLPAINIPQFTLPFELPTLLHPAVIHFVIAIPVIIVLMEIYNLFVKRKSIGAFTFILLLITIVMLVVAYLTGSADGKEAYDLLSADGQSELKAHKLLGTYVIIVSVGVLFFKLLAMTGKGFLKVLYFVFLVGFILLTLKQGKEGGELVYEHGANIQRVQALDDELFDTKEALDEMKETLNKQAKAVEVVVPKSVSEESVPEVEKVVEPTVEPTIEPSSGNTTTPQAILQDAMNEVN